MLQKMRPKKRMNEHRYSLTLILLHDNTMPMRTGGAILRGALHSICHKMDGWRYIGVFGV